MVGKTITTNVFPNSKINKLLIHTRNYHAPLLSIQSYGVQSFL